MAMTKKREKKKQTPERPLPESSALGSRRLWKSKSKSKKGRKSEIGGCGRTMMVQEAEAGRVEVTRLLTSAEEPKARRPWSAAGRWWRRWSMMRTVKPTKKTKTLMMSQGCRTACGGRAGAAPGAREM